MSGEQKRLIDANALKGRFAESDLIPKLRMTGRPVTDVIIDEAPTVDAVEVMHGHWKPTGMHLLPYLCSACESKEEGRTNYCPNCGAKMDGGS